MKRPVALACLVLALALAPQAAYAQAEPALPDVSTRAARERARQQTLAWLRSLLDITNAPGTDRYLVTSEDPPGFQVLDGLALRVELDAKVLAGEMTGAERGQALGALVSERAPALARVREAIARLTAGAGQGGPGGASGRTGGGEGRSLHEDEILYISGASVQIGAAYSYAYQGDRTTMIMALQYAIENARASRCLNEAPLIELLNRVHGGASTQEVGTTLSFLLQPEQRELLGLIGCGDNVPQGGLGPPVAGPRVVVREAWVLVAHGAPREAGYRFTVDAPARQIRVRVSGGFDDTGDRMVEVFLEDPSGRAILGERTGSRDDEFAEWVVPVQAYGIYRVVFRDLDTQDGGRYPGNGGTVEIVLE